MRPPAKMKTSGKVKLFFRWTFRVVALVTIVVLLIIGYVLRMDLYRRFVRFPREARAWAAIKADQQEVTLDDGWTDYRGPIHCHSFISHDSFLMRLPCDGPKEAGRISFHVRQFRHSR